VTLRKVASCGISRTQGSEMTLNYWMIVERYPNLKEEVGSLIPGWEISSLLDRKTCKVVNYLLCFDVGLSTFCLKNKEKEKEKEKDKSKLCLN
jgi:hypothetical protein